MDAGLNATAAALLGLLHEGPMTGGQLMVVAERRLGSFWSMTRSQVYRELPALADAGYVRMGKPGPRASQPYSITAAGKRAFSRWLSGEPGREQVRNPIALRVAFGSLQTPSQLQSSYEAATAYHTAALAHARDLVKEIRKEGDEFGASSVEFAVGYHRAVLAWLKNVPTPSGAAKSASTTSGGAKSASTTSGAAKSASTTSGAAKSAPSRSSATKGAPARSAAK